MVSLKLKLVVDKRENRVLFAEAGKDFVDYIFHILSLPLGTVTRILTAAAGDGVEADMMTGCLGRLYQGMKNLDDGHTCQASKEYLLKCKAPFCGTTYHELLPDAALPDLTSFRGSPMLPFQAASGGLIGGGYVKSPVAVFMVMDDLVVEPMSITSALSLMGRNDRVTDFENKEVEFGPDEALKLLKASLQSKTVLTDVFLDVRASPAVQNTVTPQLPRPRPVYAVLQ